MCINSVNYPGCYASPVFVEDHSNPQAKAIEEKFKDEIACKQAHVKVQFIQDTLERHKNSLTNPERYTLEYMLKDAQRELAQVLQYMNAKYPPKA